MCFEKIEKKKNTREKGKFYEEKIIEHLIRRNYKIIAQNYIQKKLEIDIIAISSDKVLVFIEVKYREKKIHKGFDIYSSISFRKQKNIVDCAEYFVNQYPKYRVYLSRYDVVFCYYRKKDFVIEHIQNAFI